MSTWILLCRCDGLFLAVHADSISSSVGYEYAYRHVAYQQYKYRSLGAFDIPVVQGVNLLEHALEAKSS
jgi:hypothetical protein